MNTLRVRTILAKLLLATSYILLVLQWLWTLLIALPPLIKSGAFDGLNSPTVQTPFIQAQPLAPSPLVLTIVGLITLIILIVTVIVLIRLPKTIMHTGERVVHQAAEAVIPVLTHHKPLPAKKRRLLSRRVTLAVQLFAALLPPIASFFLPSFDELTPQIITSIALFLAAISVFGFVTAWLIEPQTKAKTTSRTR